MSNEYWKYKANEYHNDLVAERDILHPFLAEIVNKLDGLKILDFGCGNGYLSSLFDNGKQITLYDLNSIHIDAKDRWNINNEVIICLSEKNIFKDYYDIVVQSSVLMCLPSVVKFKEVLSSNYNSLAKNGHLVISITHPCFLQYEYGHYDTSFTDENFDYLNDTLEYQVYMKRLGKDMVEFTDYNWSLSTIVNELLNIGFELIEMIEHPDLPTKEFTPKHEGCPWMFLILKK